MNVNQALNECKLILSKADIEDYSFEAGCLVEDILGYNRVALISRGNDEVEPEKLERLFELTKRRSTHEPLQYIIGKWSFCGFDFKVGEGVLIPRDDTEVVFELCREYLSNSNNNSKKTLDLCAGSGAISVALQKIANAEVTAVELSEVAYNYLCENIRLNNSSVTPFMGDIFKCHTEFKDNSFDLIVSNPPYIKTEDISGLQEEVQYEPKMALDGGSDGYDFYKAIIENWSSKLCRGGALAFELGENQAEFVGRLLLENGFSDIKTSLDFGNIQRAIIGIKL